MSFQSLLGRVTTKSGVEIGFKSLDEALEYLVEKNMNTQENRVLAFQTFHPSQVGVPEHLLDANNFTVLKGNKPFNQLLLLVDENGNVRENMSGVKISNSL